MNGTKIILGVLVGSGFTGFTLAIASYFATINSPDSSILGSESDWWVFAILNGAVFGAIVGGLSGAIITGCKMAWFSAILFSGLLNFVISVTFFFLTNGGISAGIRYTVYALIPIGFLNGVVVMLASSTQKSMN